MEKLRPWFSREIFQYVTERVHGEAKYPFVRHFETVILHIDYSTSCLIFFLDFRVLVAVSQKGYQPIDQSG